MAGCGYLALHAATPGRKTLRLPRPAMWTDLRRNTVVAHKTDTMELDAAFGQTLLYAIDPE